MTGQDPGYKTTIEAGDRRYTNFGNTAKEAERRAHEDYEADRLSRKDKN